MISRVLSLAVAVLICVAYAHAGIIRSPEAQALLNYMNEIYGKKMLSGTMANVNWNINEAQWVYEHTGRWPAINCFDFIHHMSSQQGGWIDYSDTNVVEDWHSAGGIVSIMWHWNVPAKRNGEYAFYSEKTDFDVRKIFDEKSWEYALMIKDIDQIASYLKLLKNKHIPIIWRPLHEAGGKWFWWGRDADACKRLWHVMYQRFEDAGLDNLIWVFTPAAAWKRPFEDGMQYYPGDNYVDIVGFDIYNVSDAQVCHDDYYKFLHKQCPDKLVAVTECGNMSTIGSQWQAGDKWLFFMPWYDYNRTKDLSSSAFRELEHGNASVTWWKDAWSQDFVLSRDQVSY